MLKTVTRTLSPGWMHLVPQLTLTVFPEACAAGVGHPAGLCTMGFSREPPVPLNTTSRSLAAEPVSLVKLKGP